jgi:hypothetical protein
VQEEILEKNPAADIQVYAVWFNMFPGDDRSGWDFSLLSDPRGRHFWDEDKLAGRFFSQSEGFYLPVAWDIYYLYGPDAHWEDKPSPLVSWGYTIMRKRNQLHEDVSRLWASNHS